MWILRYLILATRQRCNTMLDRRTRMTFDPLHGCPMHVCQDKAEWDRRGKDQVAHLESELRQDIEAYNTVTQERRAIAGETIEVRPVVLEQEPEPMEAFKEFLGSTQAPAEKEAVEETILPEEAPETEAASAPTGDALVSSGVEAQAEAEPGADPTLSEELTVAEGREAPLTVADGGLAEAEPEGQGPDQSHLASGAPSTEVPAATVPTVPATAKPKTKPAGKAGKK